MSVINRLVAGGLTSAGPDISASPSPIARQVLQTQTETDINPRLSIAASENSVRKQSSDDNIEFDCKHSRCSLTFPHTDSRQHTCFNTLTSTHLQSTRSRLRTCINAPTSTHSHPTACFGNLSYIVSLLPSPFSQKSVSASSS